MRVFNLTRGDLHFRKKVIKANGGFEDFPELDSFIPDSDRNLETRKVIAFKALPSWWVLQKKAEEAKTAVKVAVPAVKATTDAILVENTPVKLEVEQLKPTPVQGKKK